MAFGARNVKVTGVTAPTKQEITIRVPGTVANLGPGYDCLGAALDLHNRVRLRRLEEEAEEAHPMVQQVAELFFERTRMAPFAFSWEIEGEVPMSRGLGSSVTLRQGILQGLNELCGRPLGRADLFELCSRAEGHPDNAGPGVFGGFVVTGEAGRWFRFEIPEQLRFALLVPDYEVLTEEARSVLPESVSHSDATRNTGNACIVTAAFATGDFEQLRGAFGDYLHQDYRLPLVPGLYEVIEAGTAAGAFGGFLCGSGSTMACLCEAGVASRVTDAMREAHGASAAVITVVGADNEGALALGKETGAS